MNKQRRREIEEMQNGVTSEEWELYSDGPEKMSLRRLTNRDVKLLVHAPSIIRELMAEIDRLTTPPPPPPVSDAKKRMLMSYRPPKEEGR